MTHRLFVPVLAASLAIATLTTATLAGAATLEVRPGGKYAQPSAAIDAAAAGDNGRDRTGHLFRLRDGAHAAFDDRRRWRFPMLW